MEHQGTREAGAARLRVSTFKGLQNLPLYVAQRQGSFAARELSVAIEYTAGSAQQLEDLAHGRVDLIQTAPDNVVNADNNPANFGLEPATAPFVTMLFGGSNGPLSVFARPGPAAFDDLCGGALGVDNPTSGFAVVLRDLLARHGLALGRDYTFVPAGGTSARLEALRSGAVAATILYPPFDALAAQSGCRRLASSPDYYTAYASLATAGARNWVEAHGETVTHYLAALLEALRWIHDPAHAEEAQYILRTEPTLALEASTAAHAYAAFIAPVTGFGVDGMLDDAGLEQVIVLRAAYGDPPRPLGRPADYCDLRWYRRARGNQEV